LAKSVVSITVDRDVLRWIRDKVEEASSPAEATRSSTWLGSWWRRRRGVGRRKSHLKNYYFLRNS